MCFICAHQSDGSQNHFKLIPFPLASIELQLTPEMPRSRSPGLGPHPALALRRHLPVNEQQPPGSHFFMETEGAAPVQAFGESNPSRTVLPQPRNPQRQGGPGLTFPAECVCLRPCGFRWRRPQSDRPGTHHLTLLAHRPCSERAVCNPRRALAFLRSLSRELGMAIPIRSCKKG